MRRGRIILSIHDPHGECLTSQKPFPLSRNTGFFVSIPSGSKLPSGRQQKSPVSRMADKAFDL